MKKLAVILFGTLLIFGLVGIASALPVFNGSEYQVLLVGDLDWGVAKTAAEGLGTGWHLVTITSAEEQAFVASLLAPDKLYWAGASQPANEPSPLASWEWVTPEAWSYINWATATPDQSATEPNDWFGAGSEQYLALDTRWGRGGMWNDGSSADTLAGYVAEKSVVPEPATMLLLGFGLVGMAGFGRKRIFKKA